MTFPYDKNIERPRIIECTNTREENETDISVPLKIIPSFILPNGNIYYTTTDHYSANFYEEFEIALIIIESREDKENIILRLEDKLKKLMEDKMRIESNHITIFDVRNYLNLKIKCLKSKPVVENLFSSELKNVLIELLEGKILVYEYFINFVKKSSNPIDSLLSYPYQPSKVSFDEMRKRLKAVELLHLYPREFIWKVLVAINEEDTPLQAFKNTTFMQDFLVCAMEFDKIESMISKTITTSKLNKYETYFNYYLMGYDIRSILSIKYNNEKQIYEKHYYDDSLITEYEDYKYKQEADLILKKVPIEDRHKYFI